MTREQLEKYRKLLDDEMSSVRVKRENMISKDMTDAQVQAIKSVQLEELLHMNKAILMEFRYMNDKGDEVNNG